MKIVVIRHSIRNRGGDRQMQVYLNDLAEKGHEIIYWVNEINTHLRIHPKIQIKNIPGSGILSTIWFALTKKFSADIVLVDLVVIACLTATRNRQSVVYFAQDNDIFYYSFFLVRIFIDICYWLALKFYKVKTISVSEGLTGQLKKYSPQKIRTCPNGVDLDMYFDNRESKYFQERKKKVVVVLFAREDYRKGLDIAMCAIKQLSTVRKEKDWELWVIGERKIEIEGVLCKNLGFLKATEDVRDVLSCADIYLSSSRHEGLSLLQLQALACNCALVTTEAFTIVEHEKNALVSQNEDWQDLAKNLNRMMDDSELCEQLIENGQKLAQEHDVKDSCVIFEKIMTDICMGK